MKFLFESGAEIDRRAIVKKDISYLEMKKFFEAFWFDKKANNI
ncbi:MAG TPA: hypothetical protein VMT35_18390 [Ignavibacteriaceae bacterium]|nr:hypothetical protein [Ignavibacteriaceae bacterium]